MDGGRSAPAAIDGWGVHLVRYERKTPRTSCGVKSREDYILRGLTFPRGGTMLCFHNNSKAHRFTLCVTLFQILKASCAGAGVADPSTIEIQSHAGLVAQIV
jgi:hypothetical protein